MTNTPTEESARKIAEEFFTDINWELALRTGAWVQVGAFSGREFLEIIASAIREAERVAVEREREAVLMICSKVSDDAAIENLDETNIYLSGIEDGADKVADMVRARGEKEGG